MCICHSHFDEICIEFSVVFFPVETNGFLGIQDSTLYSTASTIHSDIVYMTCDCTHLKQTIVHMKESITLTFTGGMKQTYNKILIVNMPRGEG